MVGLRVTHRLLISIFFSLHQLFMLVLLITFTMSQEIHTLLSCYINSQSLDILISTMFCLDFAATSSRFVFLGNNGRNRKFSGEGEGDSILGLHATKFQ